MAKHGGYRTPGSPAAVSGPGAMSQRTDGRPGTQPVRELPGAAYGEGAEFREIQQGSPLAATAVSGQPQGGVDLSGVTGLGAPSAQPDTPVTAGAAAGPGAGVSALGLPQDPTALARADAKQLAPYLPAMIHASQQDGATPSFKRYVRGLIAKL